NAIVAVTGAAFDLTVSGRRVAMHQAFAVRQGERVTFGARATGARAYLAVDEGFAVPEVLGSRATHVKAALGGYEGRALRRGDVVPLGMPTLSSRALEGASSLVQPPHLPVQAP